MQTLAALTVTLTTLDDRWVLMSVFLSRGHVVLCRNGWQVEYEIRETANIVFTSLILGALPLNKYGIQ